MKRANNQAEGEDVDLPVTTPCPPANTTTDDNLVCIASDTTPAPAQPQTEQPNATTTATAPSPPRQSTRRTFSQVDTPVAHPLGVQPDGNRLLIDTPSIRDAGLGMLAAFDDEFLCDNILACCDAKTLLTLQECSKSLYALVNGFDVELWKERCIDLSTDGDVVYQWRWKNTYLVEYQLRHPVSPGVATIPEKYINMYQKYPTKEALKQFIEQETKLYQQQQHNQQPPTTTTTTMSDAITDTTTTDTTTTDTTTATTTHPDPAFYARTFPPQLLDIYPTYESSLPKIKAEGYFSDALFTPFLSISTFHNNKDKWVVEHNIDRYDINDITAEEFAENYSIPGKPCVLMNATKNWPAMERWGVERLLGERYTNLDTKYICGGSLMCLDKFLVYSMRCNDDDTPVYLFDKKLPKTNPKVFEDYEYPSFFAEDFFQYVDPAIRPPYVWWLLGAVRTGSTFHKDPLMTNAQNCLISGLKKWVLYPPHIVPPGITTSADQLQITAPFNVCEWFNSYYAETKVKANKMVNSPDNITKFSTPALEYDPIRDHPKQCHNFSQYKPVEIIQRPGDCVFIPATWYHMVVNLEPSVAITQNQIDHSNFLRCERFLDHIKQPELRQQLLDGVEKKHPGLHQKCVEIEKKQFDALKQHAFELKSRDDATATRPVIEVKHALVEMFQNQGNGGAEEEGFSFGFD